VAPIPKGLSASPPTAAIPCSSSLRAWSRATRSPCCATSVVTWAYDPAKAKAAGHGARGGTHARKPIEKRSDQRLDSPTVTNLHGSAQRQRFDNLSNLPSRRGPAAPLPNRSSVRRGRAALLPRRLSEPRFAARIGLLRARPMARFHRSSHAARPDPLVRRRRGHERAWRSLNQSRGQDLPSCH